MTNTEASCKWCEDSFCAINALMRLSAASAVSRLARAVSTLASETARTWRGVCLTFEGDISFAQDGLGAGKIGLFNGYIELNELGALATSLTAFEPDAR